MTSSSQTPTFTTDPKGNPAIPLTSIFTPPTDICTSSVSSILSTQPFTGPFSYSVYAGSSSSIYSNFDNQLCSPPGLQEIQLTRSGIYSPGVCPDQWTAYPSTTFVVGSASPLTRLYTSTVSLASGDSLVSVFTGAGVDVTVVSTTITQCVCCPNLTGSCQATTTLSTPGMFFSVSIRNFVETLTRSGTTFTEPQVSYITPPPYIYTGIATQQDVGIPIAWQADDLANMSPASAVLNQLAISANVLTEPSIAMSKTSSYTASSVSAATAPPGPATSHAHPTNLSPGGKIGLGVGLGLGLLLVSVLLVILVVRKRKTQGLPMVEPVNYEKAELPGGEDVEKHRAELSPETEIRELETAHKPVEIGETERIVELEGGSTFTKRNPSESASRGNFCSEKGSIICLSAFVVTGASIRTQQQPPLRSSIVARRSSLNPRPPRLQG
nr:hypothetical protein CFP56_64697 [Quercus suber]